MNSLLASLFPMLLIAQSVVAQGLHTFNPYIPVLVVPKNPLVQCPSSCSSAKDCFVVHPLSENHFYSCFHGKAMVHQCPIGKSFSDEKHQCIVSSKHSGVNGLITNAKVAKLTKKIVLLEQLIESFQEKMTKVQKVIIDSDNKIGLLGKFLLKALKTNQENLCSKTNQKEATQAPAGAASGEAVPVIESEFTPPPGALDEEEQIEQNGLASIGDDEQDTDQEGPPSISVPANSPKVEQVAASAQVAAEQADQPLSKDEEEFVNVSEEEGADTEDEGVSVAQQTPNQTEVGAEESDEGVQVDGPSSATEKTSAQ